MPDATVVEWIAGKYAVLRAALNERSRRLWAAAEARSLGRGGIAAVMAATGMSSATVAKGLGELDGAKSAGVALPPGRIRQPGGGRKRVRETQPGLPAALARLVEPTARGDPQSRLRWTCKSTSKLASELRRQGFQVGARTVAKELKEQQFSLQANRKTREGESHPDRNAQFGYINEQVMRFQKRGQPAISVDTKKKELVGDFKNIGREWRRRGKPQEVRVHDFPDPTMTKAIPYGVYDLTRNEGWVSVGIDHDTARFAVASIKRWWRKMGKKRYPQAKQLLITADCGGSNSSRTRLWKVALQELADDLGLRLSVCHFPPGTSKWNKIEHRMFCHITQNWRGRPLTS
jgi:predicted fused transcriptional regulator/phosphomethylpyrimidine kinase